MKFPGVLSAGYTLLELLVVIALVGLIVAFAAPGSVRAVEGAQLNADARHFAVTVRSLQAEAFRQQKRISLSIAMGAIKLSDSDISVELANGSSVSFAGDTKGIVFYEDGTVSGGRAELILDDRHVSVDVAWLTGRTTIEAVP